MTCIGAFKAQYFKALSFDPNTIFQFFVFEDRVFKIKVGTAFNQALQVAMPHVVKGPVGLDDYARSGLPTLEQARRLVEETRKVKALSLESAIKSREIENSSIASCELRTKGFFKKGLQLELVDDEKMFFRFLESSDEIAASRLLTQVLKGKFVRID